MNKKIKVNDLKICMYVDFLVGWFKHKHGFQGSSFIISSDEQIKKIIKSGYRDILVNYDKSIHNINDLDSISHEQNNKQHEENKEIIFEEEIKIPPPDWSSEKNISEQLKEAINDKKMSPGKKAKFVYESSIQLMDKLLKSPTAENIKTTKDGIADIVDLILVDDDTSKYLLNITSHDFYTYTHSVNIGVLSVFLSKALFRNLDNHDIHELGSGFFLYDIGKTMVDSKIINKPGEFIDEEMKRMRIHPYQGYKILKEANQLCEVSKIIVMQHREREDGTGFPANLKKMIFIFIEESAVLQMYLMHLPQSDPIKQLSHLLMPLNS